ncbi:hypothetical protein SeSB_A1297 [Salmonella enterica subsp. enterica serovar Schwarzengrund str. SL480]|uniref:Uncharacterized protein n=1 Tax=Salmonella schwarzengrund (strain CVM19633) TaxID=439843 RepID=A0A0N1QUE4_SALSV|nr:hypothetical protein SeSA_A1096 [Salmonella enterica subsp. enterica serovar Schwarzengrund str. CVM19633]EDY29152.1 hypothetical protein SeSB_A1297 [Salmonella enterica subsp. enterica serovar Schwarzengrund str. SL480]
MAVMTTVASCVAAGRTFPAQMACLAANIPHMKKSKINAA